MDKKNDTTLLTAVENLIDEDRVMGFTDSVFAFAATLLVIKIDLPAVIESQLSINFVSAFTSLWPQYLANIITFMVIGFYWLNHHAIFALISKISRGVVWLNVLFLIFLSFLPFPVDLYGDHNTIPIVVAFYCASLSLVGFLLASVWIYAVKAKLIKPHVTRRRMKMYTLQYLTAPVVFFISVPLAFIHPLIAQFSWVFILLILFFITKLSPDRNLSELEKLAAD